MKTKRPVRKDMVQTNHYGWFALKHKEGWWVGTEKGVTCYQERILARAALTVAWQRDGGKELNYRVERFAGVPEKTGEYTPKYSATEAMERYEKKV